MLHRLWAEIGIVERYLHQSWAEIQRMTVREFRLHVLTAYYWKAKEGEALGEQEDD